MTWSGHALGVGLGSAANITGAVLGAWVGASAQSVEEIGHAILVAIGLPALGWWLARTLRWV